MCYVHYSQATIDKQSEAVDLSLAGLQKAFLTLTGMEVYNIYTIYFSLQPILSGIRRADWRSWWTRDPTWCCASDGGTSKGKFLSYII